MVSSRYLHDTLIMCTSHHLHNYICLSVFPLPHSCLQIEPQFATAEQKNKLLRSVAGGGMDELPQLRTRWDKFEIMMESHQRMIKDQVRVKVLI